MPKEKTLEDQTTVVRGTIGMGIAFEALRKLPAPPISILRHFWPLDMEEFVPGIIESRYSWRELEEEWR